MCRAEQVKALEEKAAQHTGRALRSRISGNAFFLEDETREAQLHLVLIHGTRLREIDAPAATFGLDYRDLLTINNLLRAKLAAETTPPVLPALENIWYPANTAPL